ncbi:23S rRNA (uracil(747)-C(5))-methyltransferase RlmC [Myceligenerans crystallogenes]|uniref:23S rRNA (uracil(747)-C(5))-methyltransferase RlmC n=1 Tax=Myceligenerans crystallogenes TaxID=316335 RepID=UPI0031D40A2F
MQCSHYEAGRCRSCALLETPYATQVADKQEQVARLLDAPGIEWLPPVTGPESGFRNKAKMVVSGTIDAPVLGILDPAGRGVDLTDCGLYPPALQAVFAPLTEFVTRARLEPYQVTAPRNAPARGELKYVLVTISPDDEFMVRFVMRSTEAVARIRKHLPWLRAALPGLVVVTVNVQPAHAAVLEGDREIVLTEREALTMRVGGVPLQLRPQSFFQTNTRVAAALYRQAREWVDDVSPAGLWDLYCGVGGFALHCAAPGRAVAGIELSAEAVAAASATAAGLGLTGVTFEAGDAGAVVGRLAESAPEMVVVNPPRRGIGPELARALDASEARHVLYSSCNATTLAADLAHMPGLRPVRGVLLDMFPQTRHYEVLIHLTRA